MNHPVPLHPHLPISAIGITNPILLQIQRQSPASGPLLNTPLGIYIDPTNKLRPSLGHRFIDFLPPPSLATGPP